MQRPWAIGITLLLLAACGSPALSTGPWSDDLSTDDLVDAIDLSSADAGFSDDSVPLGDLVAEPEDGAFLELPGAPDDGSAPPDDVFEIPEPCTEDPGRKRYPECDDGIPCTIDWCHVDRCMHTPNDGACPPAGPCKSFQCTAQAGCVASVNPGIPCPFGNDQCVLSAACDEQGNCVPTATVECPDSACQSSGSCVPATGECLYGTIELGSCDDGNPCTVDDLCDGGVCLGLFDPGACACDVDADCAPFDDGDACNGAPGCVDGLCQVAPASIPVCPEPPPGACWVSLCDPGTGECLEELFAPGTLCDDGDPCTVGDQCLADGTCGGKKLADGSPCDLDGNLCTLDLCQQGSCKAGKTKACPASVSPCFQAACAPDTGLCKETLFADGAPCSATPDCDCTYGQLCLEGQSCLAGICQGGYSVCVDCSLAANAGHHCDDGDPETRGDLCFQSQCVGFHTAWWADANAKASGIAAATTHGETGHALGTKLKEEADGTPLALFLAWSGEPPLAGSSPYAGPALTDIDGRVAVGPPDRAFYLGAAWTGNNKLRNALLAACPAMGTATQPVRVAHRTYGGSGAGEKPLEMALVGFARPDGGATDACVLALCSRTGNATDWSCQGVPAAPLAGETLPPQAPSRVTALWLPVAGIACDGPTFACFPESAPAYVALRADPPGGTPQVLLLRAEATEGDGVAWEALHFEEAPGGDDPPFEITAVRADGFGLVAAGTHGLLVGMTPDGEGGALVLPPTPGFAVPHYYGIYRSPAATLLATVTAASPGEGPVPTVSTGVTAGPGGPLGPGLPFSPTYVELAAFPLSPGSLEGLSLRPGLTDLAVRDDHPGSGGTEPGKTGPVLLLGGTAVHPDSGLPAGFAALLDLP